MSPLIQTVNESLIPYGGLNLLVHWIYAGDFPSAGCERGPLVLRESTDSNTTVSYRLGCEPGMLWDALTHALVAKPLYWG